MTKTEQGLLEALKKSVNVLDSVWLQGYIHVGDEYGEKISKGIKEVQDAIEVAESLMGVADAPPIKRKVYIRPSRVKAHRYPQYHLSVYERVPDTIVVTVHALSQDDVQLWVREVFNLILQDGREPTGVYFTKAEYGFSNLVLEFKDATMDDSKDLARNVAGTLDSILLGNSPRELQQRRRIVLERHEKSDDASAGT